MRIVERFARLPTAAKLLLILTIVLLPIGIALAWMGNTGIVQANTALESRNQEQSRAAAQAIQSLVARNALALRIAAAGALRGPKAGVCAEAAQALASAPAISQRFSLRSSDGKLLCTAGGFLPKDIRLLVPDGAIRVWLNAGEHEVDIRVGVPGGMVTASIPAVELRNAVTDTGAPIRYAAVRDSGSMLTLLGTDERLGTLSVSDWPIGSGNVIARIGVQQQRVTAGERLTLLLPVLMWILAAVITWSLVSRLLVRPLRRLEHSVRAYRPGGGVELPAKLGPSEEIRGLRSAFARAIAQVEDSEREMTGALEGQRRLVREVHHRVKNNLQVVASLLNIHGRSAETVEARAAYAGISRRVGALSIVHRNHFAEMEENRGISLRALVTELAAELRATAPDTARGLAIDLDIDTLYTTQDVAVAVAFLITEIVEFAMLNAPEKTVELSLRRTSELTARLSLGSPVLVPDEEEAPEKIQFERIVVGLAKQLRSPLDRKLGRYSVDLPVFPPA